MLFNRGPLFLSLAIVILSAGCVTDVANRYYLAERLTPKDPSVVAVLNAAPQRPYRVVADFQSRGSSVSSLQAQAAALGADAVIISNLGGSYSFAESWAGDDRFNGTGSRVVGTAITYK